MTQPSPVTIVLAGIGGYGEVYLDALLDGQTRGACRLTGAVDPDPGRCRRLDELRQRGIRVFPTLDEFYRTARADLAVLASPIHEHAPQTCRALENGSHVLCEKPAAATVQDIERMSAAGRRAGRWVAVGYQWSFTDSIQALKQDLLSGMYGAPRRLKSLTLWPRNAAYYARNDWAGRLRTAGGAWILDGPANNAMAHDLHNMLFVLGGAAATSARPARVTAELYRANAIESYDTAALRVITDAGVEVLFFGSHAVPESHGPVFSFELTGGTITYAGGTEPIRGTACDGSAREYAAPDSEPHLRKLWACVQFAGAAGRSPAAIPCPLEAARAHTLCINGAHDSTPQAAAFPPLLIRRTNEGKQRLAWVDGLEGVLRRCFEDGLLPTEAGVEWARPGRSVDLCGYAYYPGGRRP